MINKYSFYTILGASREVTMQLNPGTEPTKPSTPSLTGVSQGDMHDGEDGDIV